MARILFLVLNNALQTVLFGIDTDDVVYLFDNNQNVFASAHASDIEGTVSSWRVTWLTIDDKRYVLEFVPLADKIAPSPDFWSYKQCVYAGAPSRRSGEGPPRTPRRLQDCI